MSGATRFDGVAQESWDTLAAEADRWMQRGDSGPRGLVDRIWDRVRDEESYPGLSSMSLADVEAAVAELVARRRAVEAAWVGESDADRVTVAFRELRTRGIVALESFTCCNECGHSEARELRQADSTGYVFYHEQDVERAVEGHRLFLSFACYTPPTWRDLPREEKQRLWDAADIEVGDAVVAALRRAGLTPSWSRSAAARIVVQVPDWRRRLPQD